MLVIRDKQMQVLAAERRRRLPGKILLHIQSSLPDRARALGEPALAALIDRALARAAAHDLTAEWDLCRFCWLAAVHGADFDRTAAWARDILAFTELTPTARVDALEAHHATRGQETA
jgi:hypothetical protein